MLNKSRHFLWLMVLIILSGCTIGKSDPTFSTQSFAAYAESVFRRQNNATSQVMMLSTEEVAVDQKDFNGLLAAEKKMHHACTDLVAYAQASQIENSTSLLQRARAGKAINACDQATYTLESLLKSEPQQ